MNSKWVSVRILMNKPQWEAVEMRRAAAAADHLQSESSVYVRKGRVVLLLVIKKKKKVQHIHFHTARIYLSH